MNDTHFYFKTTSKIVLTLLFSTKKLKELEYQIKKLQRVMTASARLVYCAVSIVTLLLC